MAHSIQKVNLMTRKLSEIFAKNRAEEFPDDVYGKYVLPRNYNSVNLSKMTKACIVIGGRGYGKTMFLKYHCHNTILSKNQKEIKIQDLKTIGIYWRPDTSFTQHMSEKWLGEYWHTTFKTYFSINIMIEFTKFLINLGGDSSPLRKYKDEIFSILLPEPILDALNINTPLKMVDAARPLQNSLFKICNWVNAPISPTPPFAIDVKSSLDLIISDIVKICSELEKIQFHIFVDEFENLTFGQQEIVNTLMKHGKHPLLFSVAYKKNANVSHKTLSDEHVVEQHDYRIIDLENLYIDDFETFAGEILALRLSEFKYYASFKDRIINKNEIDSRKDLDYQKLIRQLAAAFLPEMTSKDISSQIIEDKAMRNKLESLINYGLKTFSPKSKIKSSDLVDEAYPEASIINGALVNRKNSDTDFILNELKLYKSGAESKYRSWIPNNLVGMIIHIYNLFPNKYCPIYAGYNQFVKISRGNIRHFLELCHQSVLKAEIDNEIVDEELDEISIYSQSYATKKASELEIDKIPDLGAQGIHLKRVAKRLGKVFNYSQSRRSQSESEVNHFTLDMTDKSSLSETTQVLLNESLVWSVLIETESTKSKSNDNLEEKDYLLHPVLSPYFGISHRKKRKIKFSVPELEIIFSGDDAKFSELLKTYKKKWQLDDSDDMDNEYVGAQLGLL